jgi:hypothetical protein
MSTVVTNYAVNPSAENADINVGWNVYAGGGVRSRDATEHASGSYSAKFVATGVDQYEGLRGQTAAPLSLAPSSDLLIGTIEVKGTGTINFARMRASYSDFTGVNSDIQSITLTSSWVKYTFSLTLNPAKTVDDFQMILIRDDIAAAFTVYADKLLFVKGLAEAPGYFDGDTTDTATDVYEWTGTPNASMSTWTNTPITFDSVDHWQRSRFLEASISEDSYE